jgi:ADP-heptose:LPS heptosyltransferase
LSARLLSDSVLVGLGQKPRIVVLKAGGLGDFLVTTPALRALRQTVPAGHITLLTSQFIAPFCVRYAGLDRALAVPPYPGVMSGPYDEGVASDFMQKLRDEHFDLAIQWQGNGRNSNAFVLQIGARLSVGFRDPPAPDLDLSIPFDLQQHEALRCLDTLRLLGIDGGGIEMDLPLLDDDFQELSKLADCLDLKALHGGQYLGLHVSAGGRTREWPPARFAAVADGLLEAFPLRGVIVSAGPERVARAAEVVASMRRPDLAVDVAGRLSLGGMAALLSRLPLCVSCDTGIGHMAVALGVPTVVVFGSGHPLNWAPLTRAWQRPVANWTAPCRFFVDDGCGNDESVTCLHSVSVEQALDQAVHILRLREKVRALSAGLSPATMDWVSSDGGGRAETEPSLEG